MKKYFIISITILLFLILTVTTVVADDSKGLVYYLLPNLLDEFQTAAEVAVKGAVERVGYTCQVLSAADDVSTQLNQIDIAITQNPKAIIVNAVDGVAICDGVNKARNAGIFVIAYDRLITQTTVDFSSVAGCKKMGIKAAHEIVNLLKKKYGGEVKGSILDIMGALEDSYTILIEEGFQEVMKDYPDVKIETKSAEKWEASKAGDIAEDYLLVHSDVDVIFPHSDHLTAAIISVLQGKGFEQNDIFIVSCTGMPMGLDLVREGWIAVDVEQPTIAQAEGIAMFLDDIINGNEIKVGSYEILGIPAEMSMQPFGLELSIEGTAINAENVEDPKFWGNQVKK